MTVLWNVSQKSHLHNRRRENLNLVIFLRIHYFLILQQMYLLSSGYTFYLHSARRSAENSVKELSFTTI